MGDDIDINLLALKAQGPVAIDSAELVGSTEDPAQQPQETVDESS